MEERFGVLESDLGLFQTHGPSGGLYLRRCMRGGAELRRHFLRLQLQWEHKTDTPAVPFVRDRVMFGKCIME